MFSWQRPSKTRQQLIDRLRGKGLDPCPMQGPTEAELKAWRARCGLTQPEAAMLLGLPDAMYDAYERGRFFARPYIWPALTSVEAILTKGNEP